jgi:hypothetical protein
MLFINDFSSLKIYHFSVASIKWNLRSEDRASRKMATAILIHRRFERRPKSLSFTLAATDRLGGVGWKRESMCRWKGFPRSISMAQSSRLSIVAVLDANSHIRERAACGSRKKFDCVCFPRFQTEVRGFLDHGFRG